MASITPVACVVAAVATAAPARAIVAGTVNIAAAKEGGKIISTSGGQADNAKWAVRNLIDGQRVHVVSKTPQLDSPESFGWCSRDSQLPQEIVFAFNDERPRLIGKIVVDPVTADPAWLRRWAKNFDILVSNTTPDGAYNLIDSYELAGAYLPNGQGFEFAHPVEARYVKLRITSNQGSDKFTELGEFEVYEAIMGANELEKLIIAGEQWLTKLFGFRDGREFLAGHPDAEAPGAPRNVSAAQNGATVVSATSEMPDAKWAKENLIDGKHVRFVDDVAQLPEKSWGWRSTEASFPQDIVIQLAGDGPVLIDAIVMDPATAAMYIIGRGVKGFELLTSTSSATGPWQLAGRFSLMNRPSPQAFEFTATEARWVKIRILGNHGSDKFVEFGEAEIYEAIIPQEPLTQIVSQCENAVRELKQYWEELRATEGAL
jgi:hypothetical protein